jgi:hypothetical protein
VDKITHCARQSCREGLAARNLRKFGVRAKLAKCTVFVSSNFSPASRGETLSKRVDFSTF